MTHAPISPSKLPRYIACPGSFSLESKAARESQSEYARLGTLAHEVIAELIQNRVPPGQIEQAITADLPEEYKLAVRDCLDWLKDYTDQLQINNMLIEQKVSLAYYGLEEIYGTADVIILEKATLHIIDWKFGKGVQVSPDSAQLLAYAAGALSEYGYGIDQVKIWVAQPRLNSYLSHERQVQAIDIWVEEILKPAIEKAKSSKPDFIPGDEQCRWCRGKNLCPARYHLAMKTAQQVFKAVEKREKTGLTVEEMESFIIMEDFFKTFLKDVKAEYMAALEKGEIKTENFKLVEGRSIRTWKNFDKAAEVLLDEFQLEPYEVFKASLISPAQAEKLIPPGQRKKLADLWEKPAGNVSLAPITDKRPAIKNRAEHVFKEYKT